MESFYVESKMTAEDFKSFLFYNQYYSERYYLVLRVGISVIIGLFAAYFSSSRVLTFLAVALMCMLVFIAFPWISIRRNYKKLYRRNRSGAFSQMQKYKFGENNFGFKGEFEDDFFYEEYANLMRAVETNKLFILCYSKKNTAVVVKSAVTADDTNRIRAILMEKMNKKYLRLKQF